VVGGSGREANAWDGAVQEGADRFEALFPNCQRPRDMLNSCRRSVASGEGKRSVMMNESGVSSNNNPNCVRESRCYLACSSAHNQQKRLVNSQCGAVLFDGPARNIGDRFRGCLSGEEGGGSVAVCQDKLAKMLQCAQHTLTAKQTE
jgi:hypothetical protein